METAKNYYNKQYENWVPWMEDKYLAWFGQNKTSYVAEGMHAADHVHLPFLTLCRQPQQNKDYWR